MKRQRGRGRKPGGGGGGGGNHGGHNHGHNANRSFESNGPDMKVRGSASHIFEKYMQLARDATTGGDRVLAESYLQHAEHYFRVMRAMQPAFMPQTAEQRFGPDLDEDEDQAQIADGEADIDDDGEAPREPRPDRQERRPDRPRFDRGDRGDRRDRPDRPERLDRPERPERERVEVRDRPEPRDRPDPRDRPELRDAPQEAIETPVRAEGEEEVDGEFRRRRPRRGRFRSDTAAPEGERPPREPAADGVAEGFGDGPRPAFLAGE